MTGLDQWHWRLNNTHPFFTHKIRFNNSKIKMAVHIHYVDQSKIWVGLICGHFYLFSFWKQRKTKQTKGPQISLISVVSACIREPVLIDHHHQIYQEESSFLVAGYSSCVLHWACFWGIRCHKSEFEHLNYIRHSTITNIKSSNLFLDLMSSPAYYPLGAYLQSMDWIHVSCCLQLHNL